MTDRSELLITTEELAARLGEANLVILDTSWYLPHMGRDGAAEFAAARIPGAVRFDIDAISDPSSGLPHMLASAEAFAKAVGALGVGDGSSVVVYDGMGLFAAPRVWWNLVIYGARDVRVLDGGMPKWKAEGRPLETGAPKTPAPAVFTPKIDAARVADLDAVVGMLASGEATVVDARPGERFRGEAPEPRPGLRGGHMPGARSVPFASVATDGCLGDEAKIRAAFSGVDLDRPIICSCGSGVSSAVLWLALEAIGVPRTKLALYDGSWSEWGASPATAVVTGP
ncbi:MAG: sulfurtransferase [Siculibacillus sp.]|nr:sulfurtransferase [Siculibacillus sp.]